MSCHEISIELPDNTTSVCWWLSVNFALFHKKREELDDFFKNDDYDEKLIDSNIRKTFHRHIKPSMKIIYDYYSTSNTTQDKIQTFILDEMKSDHMKTVFNVPSFDVASKKFQDASEYLGKLCVFIDNIPKIMIEKDNNKLSLYDIFVFKKYYGIVDADTSELKHNKPRKDIFRYNDSTKTLIFEFNRRDPDNTEFSPVTDELNVKETIIIPLYKTDKSNREIGKLHDAKNFSSDDTIDPVKGEFKLDAVVIATPGHFTSVVKCSDSETWVHYKALSGTQKRDTYDNFSSMVEATKLKTGVTMLFYTRVSS